jgi:uncharacterized protein Smg (DUF494 family)
MSKLSLICCGRRWVEMSFIICVVASIRHSENMFDILVYLYETYYRSEACPDSDVLVKKLSAVGFEEEEISRAIGWLSELSAATSLLATQEVQLPVEGSGFRIYAPQEFDVLGTKRSAFFIFSNQPACSTPPSVKL